MLILQLIIAKQFINLHGWRSSLERVLCCLNFEKVARLPIAIFELVGIVAAIVFEEVAHVYFFVLFVMQEVLDVAGVAIVLSFAWGHFLQVLSCDCSTNVVRWVS